LNILYHHRTMGRGAEGSHIAHIVKAFKAAGHNVTVVSPPGVDPLKSIGAKPLDKTDEKVQGVTILWRFISRHAPQFFFEILEVGYNFQAIPRLGRIIREKKIDCIYERSAFFLFSGAFASQRHSIPLIVEANEAVGIERARKLFLVWLASRCERYTMKRADTVFTVSSYLAGMLSRHAGSTSRIVVMPNAIDPERFSQPVNGAAIRKRLGITGKTVLGFAGWFDWWDRLDLLIELQAELVELGYTDVVTLLVGHGTMVGELQDQVVAHGISDNVFFTGPVEKSDVLDYIDALDIGVLPHSNEFGSPMVLFEMMALGKCVVAPDVAPITDVVEDGVNGVIFPCLDKEALKMKIIALLKDKPNQEKIGRQARERVMRNNTWEKNAERILQSVTAWEDK